MSENIMYKNIADKMKAQQERIEYLERSNNRREDTIMGLRNELGEAEDSITWWNNRYNALQRDYEELQQENERLQINLGLKQFIKHTEMNFCKLEDELEDYKSRCEKAVELLQNDINFGDLCDGYKILNILNGRSDK